MVDRLNKHGEEVPDPQPLEIPSGMKIPETMEQLVQRLVRNQVSEHAASQGYETFEDSEDFDIDDEMFEPSSPYEEVFDPVLQRGITLDEFRKNEAVYQQRFLDAENKAYRQMELSDALRARPRKKPSGGQNNPPAEQSGREATPGETPLEE